MTRLVIACSIFILGTAAFGDDQADRAKLLGTWQLEQGSGKDGSAWTLEDKASGMHIVRSKNNQKLEDFECNTVGRDCDITDAAHNHAKVSLYFNGPKLVEYETRGSEVIKYRLSVQGDAMEVEVIPVVPSGNTEVLKFKRVQLAASQK